jgi:hypothetical protein
MGASLYRLERALVNAIGVCQHRPVVTSRALAGLAAAGWLAGCGSGSGRAPTPDAGTGDDATNTADAADGAADAAAAVIQLATPWPMPNPAASGLPNPAQYDTSQPGVVIDRVTGLSWQRDVDPASYLPPDAAALCAGLSLGGAAWRLPTLIELLSIVDFTRSSPSIDPDAFPATPGDSFWTSTPVVGADGPSGQAWYVGFTTGFSYQGHVDFLALRVRCVGVQPGASAGVSLTWQRTDSGQALTWAAAGASCAALDLDGGGWRLPSVKELETTIDVTRSDPAVDPAPFPGASSYPLWTSSLLAGSSTEAWTVDFFLGAATTADTSTTYQARCVR